MNALKTMLPKDVVSVDEGACLESGCDAEESVKHPNDAPSAPLGYATGWNVEIRDEPLCLRCCALAES